MVRKQLARGRVGVVLLLFGQIANESSNSMAATVFPWLAGHQEIVAHVMLAALAMLCVLLASLCFVLQKLSVSFDLLKLWWPACLVSAGSLLLAMLTPGNNPGILALALIVLACSEPIIELGSSVLLPEVAVQSGIPRQKLNSLLISVGALSAAAAPLLMPMAARQLSSAQLIDLVLALALAGMIGMLPLRHLQLGPCRDAGSSGAVLQNGLAQALQYLPPAICLLLSFETVLLPKLSALRADAVLLQSWFVVAFAIGVAFGALLGGELQRPSRNLYLLINVAALIALCATCIMQLDITLLATGAFLSGFGLGTELPKIEATLQAAGATPRARIAPIMRFSAALLWRCALGLLLLAALSSAWNHY